LIFEQPAAATCRAILSRRGCDAIPLRAACTVNPLPLRAVCVILIKEGGIHHSH
jgi:hypothetical protein